MIHDKTGLQIQLKTSDILCINLFNWLGITPTINDYFFTESPFKRSFFIFYFLLLSTLATAIKVVLNYYGNKRKVEKR